MSRNTDAASLVAALLTAEKAERYPEALGPVERTEGHFRPRLRAAWQKVRIITALAATAAVTGVVIGLAAGAEVGIPAKALLDDVRQAQVEFQQNRVLDAPLPHFHRDGKVHILGIGDSAEAGNDGARVYKSTTGLNGSRPCKVSYYALSYQVARDLGGDGQDLACSGSIIPHVLQDQVPRIPRDTDIALVTVGANDLKFADEIGSCFANIDRSCIRQVHAEILNNVDRITTGLVQVLKNTKDKIKPGGLVVLVGYANPIPAETLGAWRLLCDTLRADDVRGLNTDYGLLNSIMKNAAKEAGVPFFDAASAFSKNQRACEPGSVFADVTPWRLLVGGQDQMWLHLTTDGDIAEAEEVTRFVMNYALNQLRRNADPTYLPEKLGLGPSGLPAGPPGHMVLAR